MNNWPKVGDVLTAEQAVEALRERHHLIRMHYGGDECRCGNDRYCPDLAVLDQVRPSDCQCEVRDVHPPEKGVRSTEQQPCPAQVMFAGDLYDCIEQEGHHGPHRTSAAPDAYTWTDPAAPTPDRDAVARTLHHVEAEWRRPAEYLPGGEDQ